jgi:hypothetical protein
MRSEIERTNLRSFDFALRASLRMTLGKMGGLLKGDTVVKDGNFAQDDTCVGGTKDEDRKIG